MLFLDALKQFVPSRVCLACDGCCRFRSEGTCWQPKMAAEEVRRLSGTDEPAKRLLQQTADPEGRIPLIGEQDIFICHFFNPRHNTCGIYHVRPLECRLYPFLLVKTNPAGIALAAHLLCPYVQQQKDSPEWAGYVRTLREWFRRDDVRAFLMRNPALAGDYGDSGEEVAHLFTIDPP